MAEITPPTPTTPTSGPVVNVLSCKGIAAESLYRTRRRVRAQARA
jgi:hypothetical protein